MNITRWIATTALLPLLVSAAACSKQDVSFARDVNPILQKDCSGCHVTGGKGYLASGFSVESYASVIKGTKFGPVIVPGSSVSSTLARLIDHKADPSINMPQGKPQLSKGHVELIAAWIDQGAKNN